MGGLLVASQLAGLTVLVGGIVETQAQIALLGLEVPQSSGPYRPPLFNQPALYSITTAATSSADAAMYVFDAVPRVSHSSRARLTDHPVQTGASVNDNIILEALRITLEIGMSDALDSYSTNMWSGDASKSVSAYQTMLQVQAARGLLTLSTRLNTYRNMILESVEAVETNQTRYGLRAVLSFKEVFVASIASQSSARPQTTDSTPMGEVTPAAPNKAVLDQHQVEPTGGGSSFSGSGSGLSTGGTGVVSTGATSSDANAGTPVPYVAGGGTFTSGNVGALGGP